MTGAMIEGYRQDTIACSNDSEQLITIRQFCERFPWPSESAMRSYCHRAEDLKLAEAFLRVNRRVLVSPSKFFSLIRRLNQGGQKNETMSTPKGKEAL